ncbi:hypothetical protein [Myxococcus sp. Y35]|uniref:hypothetical protein n=1 Tax=Pseudomyxococcus flavus TaxID=3115648 RepID=UPI003CF7AFCE
MSCERTLLSCMQDAHVALVLGDAVDAATHLDAAQRLVRRPGFVPLKPEEQRQLVDLVERCKGAARTLVELLCAEMDHEGTERRAARAYRGA